VTPNMFSKATDVQTRETLQITIFDALQQSRSSKSK